jgi:hypothetical protein
MFHCHTFPANPARFPADARLGLFPGSVEHLLVTCRNLGFDAAVALSPNEAPEGRCTSRVDPGTDGIGWLASQAALNGELVLFAARDPSDKRSPDRLALALKAGFSGVKLHPPIGRFSIDARRDAAFYALLDENRTPLLIHTGVPPESSPWPADQYHPARIGRLAGEFPRIPVILAHGGGGEFCRDVFAVMMEHDNTYLDLTHTLDPRYAWHIPTGELSPFFERFGAPRIIYGTDYPWYAPEDLARDLAVLRTLGADRESLGLILGGTIGRLIAR